MPDDLVTRHDAEVALKCAPLLQAPGDEVVAQMASTILALYDRIDALEAAHHNLGVMARDRAAERDRLARVLAVERGDVTQAPEGWGRNGRGWRRGRWRVCLASVGAWFVFDVYARRTMLRRSHPTALEAMEALDAAEEAE